MLSNKDFNFWVDNGINFAIVKVEYADAILVHVFGLLGVFLHVFFLMKTLILRLFYLLH